MGLISRGLAIAGFVGMLNAAPLADYPNDFNQSRLPSNELMVGDIFDGTFSSDQLEQISSAVDQGMNIYANSYLIEQSDFDNPWVQLGFAIEIAQSVYGTDDIFRDTGLGYNIKSGKREQIQRICGALTKGCIFPINTSLGVNSQSIYIADDYFQMLESTLAHEVAGHVYQMTLLSEIRIGKLDLAYHYDLEDSIINTNSSLKIKSEVLRPILFNEKLEITLPSGHSYDLQMDQGKEFFAIYIESLGNVLANKQIDSSLYFKDAPVFTKYFPSLLLNMHAIGTSKELFYDYKNDPHMFYLKIGQSMPDQYVIDFLSYPTESINGRDLLLDFSREAVAPYLEMVKAGDIFDADQRKALDYFKGVIALAEINQSIGNANGYIFTIAES